MGAGLDIVLLLDRCCEVVEFGLGAGDEEDIETFLRELESIFFAYAV